MLHKRKWHILIKLHPITIQDEVVRYAVAREDPFNNSISKLSDLLKSWALEVVALDRQEILFSRRWCQPSSRRSRHPWSSTYLQPRWYNVRCLNIEENEAKTPQRPSSPTEHACWRMCTKDYQPKSRKILKKFNLSTLHTKHPLNLSIKDNHSFKQISPSKK